MIPSIGNLQNRLTSTDRKQIDKWLPGAIGNVERGLREGHYAQRLSPTAPVYLAAVIEYLTAKVLELAGNEAQNHGERNITPLLLDMAVHNDSLLSTLFDTTTISQVAPGGD
ncbi:histone H2A-Bbd type 2/3 isoform X2 [Rhinopithecus roxellana]|uniref:histone H2A-Bbd type 2/3 isoform X2 n=1 Tax=Rhinopithecus roxellana TaxID=61622 RepID=UPI00123778FD|nr:histone H2A-Bbd type 2/3 isoform X2 [Rhinopithecus roxellana]XP_030789601.1 histone H2A-Bbd type 2/3 isoform X2 [Rhinopithecus roxellana]